ncbi:argininosuccinate synthase-related protein [Streptomyces sp. NPDC090077]|uniref:argininosuccinate synthase-related protein n=1 Tax=Streptomyces sp. NPDC090077 TaxID=3365938 RepID=UPI0037FBBA64
MPSSAASPLVRSFRDITASIRSAPERPVVTLFSGGLDSTYLLHRLRLAGASNVHAVSVGLDVDERHDAKEQIAAKLGATLLVVDARERFAADFVRPAIAAQAVYLGTHPISSSLSRPLIAAEAVGVADRLGAGLLLHTANRSQNTLRRLNGALGLLGWPGRYGSPYDLDPVDRAQKIQELKEAGVDELDGRTVSGDSNLWCREFESGLLDDPESHAVPEELYRWSRRPDADTTGVDMVEVAFRAGVPVALDGRALPLTELIAELNVRVGRYGMGRYSGLEHLDHGEKVLEIREMPAAWLLLRGYRLLENAVLDAETLREKMPLEQLWVREALEGRWYGELRAAVQAFIDVCARDITGSVRWRLSPGSAETRSIVAERPRYLRDRESWERMSIAAEVASHRPAI